jgi:putative peptidoglycan lipid II flippase
MARLVQRTDHGDVVHELLFQRTTIGRGLLNEVRIEDPGDRRLHAVVEAADQGSYVVHDNRSRAGVRVNGERVEAKYARKPGFRAYFGRVLAHGDVVGVGPATFVFDSTAADPSRDGYGAASARGEPLPDRRGSDITTLAGGVMRLTLGTLVSRAFGYLREMVAMSYFGCTGELDAYFAASRLPNLFRDVLGEYAAENAFLPAFKTLEARGRSAEARRLFAAVLRVVIVAGTVLVVLGIVFAPWVMALFVPGFRQKAPHLVGTATAMSRWMMPYLAFVAVAAAYSSLLLAERRFLLYSLAPIGTSVCVIASIVLLKGRLEIGSLAAGIVVGGLVHMGLCMLPYLRRRAPDPEPPSEPVTRAALRRVGRSAIPVALAGLLNKVAMVVDQVLASIFCDLGRISALEGAGRLLQLPFGIVGLAVSRAAFPLLIEQAVAREGDGFSRAVVRTLRWSVFLMLPAALGMVLLAWPVVRLMYERGHFTASHTGWVALALACYASGLVAMGARTVLSRAFYALLNTRTPFLMSAAEVALNIGLSVLLVRTSLGHGGLALGTSLATWFQAVLLLVLLHRELARQGRRLKLAGLWGGLARMALCAVAMAACVWGCELLLGRLWAGRGMVATVASVAAPGAAGLLAYIGMALALDCDEVRFLRRFGRVDRARQSD